MQYTNNNLYRHYIALDWSKKVVAMATMSAAGKSVKTRQFPSDLRVIREEIKKHTGSKILTIEETTTSQWLYVELHESVDKIIICDPYRNGLLKDGPQTDNIDAEKLCLLLRNGMLKPVYHTAKRDYDIRKFVSAYIDTMKSYVRIRNQRSAMFRSEGRDHKREKFIPGNPIKEFVTQKHYELQAHAEEILKQYEKEFKEIGKTHRIIGMLKRISGIGIKTAVMIYSTVIEADRFENKYKYWAYCGLVKQYKESGGRIYRCKPVRYSRLLKMCYKTAALAAINGKNDIREYYEYLLQNGLSADKARHQISRYISKVSYAVMRHKIEYRAYQWREEKQKAQ